MDTRTEHDALGSLDLPAHALYGIHAERARHNFPLAGRRVHPALIRAFGAVKLAATVTNRLIGALDDERAGFIEAACRELMAGGLQEHVVVDALQGGAGTSTNMNVNEVIANRALQIAGRVPGDYAFIDPLGQVNLHQSTNDTYPTALRVAALDLIGGLEQALVQLQEAFQDTERRFGHLVKVGRTELQDAVLITLGRELGAHAEAFGRDRWRVFKCQERLRVVNLGGTAIGTGLGAPRAYIFGVVDQLRAITRHHLARAENLIDATANQDALVEVSGILKACATNLMKSANDLRLLSSGPQAGLAEIRLPPCQAGSSIMPGKVNPVIPEAVIQAAVKVMANDQAIALAVGLGNLELNAFLPLVADCLLENLDLLERACRLYAVACVQGIEADAERLAAQVQASTATLTALAARIGYHAAEELGRAAAQERLPIRELALRQGLLSTEEFDALVSPAAVMRLGSSEISGPTVPGEAPRP